MSGLESQLSSAGVSVPPAPSAAAVAGRGTNGSAQPATAEDYWSPVVHGECAEGGGQEDVYAATCAPTRKALFCSEDAC